MEEENKDRTLRNNKISQFILRIDFSNDSNIDFRALAEALRPKYDSFRTELHRNYNVDVDKVEVNKEDFIKYLLGNSPAARVIIDSFQKSLIIESSHYENNTIYKGRLSDIISIIKELQDDVCADRIGMRYINTFSCRKSSEANKILSPAAAKAVKGVLDYENVARAMCISEFNYGDFMARVQYGVPNRFYPSIISNFDIVVDIDVYGQGRRPIDDWEDAVRTFNHKSYDIFFSFVKETFIETLK